MIRALRRWLLGVEPEGPPLLADPLYRYEARRYWTWGRYAFVAIALLVWTGLVTWWLYQYAPASGHDRDFALMCTTWLVLLIRAPLTFMASIGSALCIVPERVSGQLEQFILTPVDSWRFCLARLAGRLKGLSIIGLCSTLGLLGIVMIVFLEPWSQEGGHSRSWDWGILILPALIVVLGQIDLAAMLVVDAAVGMRFTATSSNTALAVIRTGLTNFVLTPVSMLLGALAVGGMTMIVARGFNHGYYSEWQASVAMAGAVVGRLALGAIAVRLALRDARLAIQKTFYEPGE